ncbi:hypothetical protein DFH11DRAFT_1746683 [Phellopilus nigrolimitatus]|nr:hypothetical protein DFH11DRAFT_1746683 [Phellopilus nigrolimitatus]
MSGDHVTDAKTCIRRFNDMQNVTIVAARSFRKGEAMLHHVYTLSNEILARIFVLAHSHEVRRAPAALPKFPRILSHVLSRFRPIAFGIPSIWAHLLNQQSSDELTTFVEWSKNAEHIIIFSVNKHNGKDDLISFWATRCSNVYFWCPRRICGGEVDALVMQFIHFHFENPENCIDTD